MCVCGKQGLCDKNHNKLSGGGSIGAAEAARCLAGLRSRESKERNRGSDDTVGDEEMTHAPAQAISEFPAVNFSRSTRSARFGPSDDPD